MGILSCAPLVLGGVAIRDGLAKMMPLECVACFVDVGRGGAIHDVLAKMISFDVPTTPEF